MWMTVDLSPNCKCDNCDEFAVLMIRMEKNDICLCSECEDSLANLMKP